MKVQLQLLSDWRIWIGLVSALSFLFSVFNLVVRRHVFNKITNNDLKHLTKDVEELKTENKEIKVDLKNELHQINLSVNRIEKKITKRDAICEERHKFDVKK